MQIQNKVIDYLNSKDEYTIKLIDIIEDMNDLIEKLESYGSDIDTISDLLEIQCDLFTEFGFRVYNALAEE